MNKVKMYVSLALCYLVDFLRFARASAVSDNEKNKEVMEGHILRIAHALEKGMAMPDPRPGYGKEKATNLIGFLKRYQSLYGADDVFGIGMCSVKSLLAYHAENYKSDSELVSSYQALVDECLAVPDDISKWAAGRKLVSKQKILGSLPENPKEFFYSRSSIRQFSDEAVSDSVLKQAIEIAQKTPSVCNRQACRVRVYRSGTAVHDVLKFQDGNLGFGDGASAVMVVTADLSAFYKSGERYQGYIDGGLYSMSLVYALHALGVGSCMLNWSQGYRSDKRFREAASIPESEIVVVMIAVGNMKEEFWVSTSPRRSVDLVSDFKDCL